MTNESKQEQSFTSFAKMDSSIHSDGLLALGRKLVEELGQEASRDTLGHWMAHHLAELMTRAESLTGVDKSVAEKDCFEAILALWKHRAILPSGKRPFEGLEPVIRTVESLDPEDDKPRYYRAHRPPRGQSADTPEQDRWLGLAEGLDYSAKLLIGTCLAEAADAALDQSKEWVKLAKAIGEDGGVSEIVIRFISDRADLDKEPDPDGPMRDLLSDRLKRLRGFMKLAESAIDRLSTRLEALPAAKTSDDPSKERIVLSPHPSLPDVNED